MSSAVTSSSGITGRNDCAWFTLASTRPQRSTAAGWGRIVNFASSMGIVGGVTFGAYNASKEAIRALTRTAAKEWAPDGIVVNAIAPAAAPPRAVGSYHYEEFMKNCPMGRNGDPELDIGAVAHFLCTDACRYLTGQTFMVDGGTFLWA